MIDFIGDIKKMLYMYKDYVHISRIEVDEMEDCRFLIVYDLDNGYKNKETLVIMKNPSKANQGISDQTVNNVLEYMHEFEYSKVYIMNLIPKYGTNSRLIKDDLSQKPDILKKNDDLICEISGKVSKVFVAWGGHGGFDKQYYDSRISAIKHCLKSKILYCYAINKTNREPKHPSRNQWKRGKSEKDFEIYK